MYVVLSDGDIVGTKDKRLAFPPPFLPAYPSGVPLQTIKEEPRILSYVVYSVPIPVTCPQYATPKVQIAKASIRKRNRLTTD